MAYATRPYNFRLSRNNPLWDRCILACLGQVPGGGLYTDSSVRNQRCEIQNDAPWVRGPFNRSGISTDGINQWVDCGKVNFAGSWSVSAWLYAEILTTSKLAIFDNLNSSGFSDGVTFLAGNIQGGSNRKLGIFSPATGWHQNNAELPPGLNAVHVAVSVNATVGLTFYINGQVDKFQPDSTSAAVISQVDAKIGRSYDNNYVAAEFYDVIVWNRAIRDEEVELLADPRDTFLSGAIAPWVEVPTVPIIAPPVEVGGSNIFRSPVIRRAR